MQRRRCYSASLRWRPSSLACESKVRLLTAPIKPLLGIQVCHRGPLLHRGALSFIRSPDNGADQQLNHNSYLQRAEAWALRNCLNSIKRDLVYVGWLPWHHALVHAYYNMMCQINLCDASQTNPSFAILRFEQSRHALEVAVG